MLREILAMHPSLSFVGAPWSAPAWMKTNDDLKGGNLKPESYGVYARYFVKYIEAMKAQGITINAITPQNEPLNPDNTPSMVMQASGPSFLSCSAGVPSPFPGRLSMCPPFSKLGSPASRPDQLW